MHVDTVNDTFSQCPFDGISPVVSGWWDGVWGGSQCELQCMKEMDLDQALDSQR